MIDTDKYEGHTPPPWTIDVHTIGKGREITAIVIESDWTSHYNCVLAEVEVKNKYAEADARLIADVPLILEDYKRLRKEVKRLREKIKTEHNLKLWEKAEIKRLQKEIEVLSKYRDIVEKYDDALLADGDTDPRWSELYA